VFNSALFEYQSGTFLTSTINQLTAGNLKDMTVPVPPAREQGAIAAHLDQEMERVDALIAKVREAIERLKELRTALISAAVTGKIDVREEVA
jgi:type I restriction enzyme S subunit